MGVFPNKQHFKGCVLGRKVRLNANMYSFNNIYFFSPLKASLCLDQKLNLLTVENSVAGFDFFKETFFFFFFFQSASSITCGGRRLPAEMSGDGVEQAI